MSDDTDLRRSFPVRYADPELNALSIIATLMGELDERAQVRALDWARAKVPFEPEPSDA